MKKKLTLIIAAVIIVAAAAALAVVKFGGLTAAGIYYSQKDSGYYLRLKHGGTFTYAYNPQKDITLNTEDGESKNIEAYIENSGTWSKNGNKITLKFEDGNIVNLIKKGDYYYNTSRIYKGVSTKEKSFSKIYTYLYDNDETRSDSVLFFDDLTVSYNKVRGGKPMTKNGTYTRTEDIITVRYSDEDNRSHKFLMLENGVTDDLYTKKPLDN